MHTRMHADCWTVATYVSVNFFFHVILWNNVSLLYYLPVKAPQSLNSFFFTIPESQHATVFLTFLIRFDCFIRMNE